MLSTATEPQPRTGLARLAYAQLRQLLLPPYRPAPAPEVVPPAPPTGVTVPPLTPEQVDALVAHDVGRHFRYHLGYGTGFHVSRYIPGVAQLLDVVRPRWFAEVDVTVLDLASPTRCVLGQLYPTFACGVHELETYLASRHHETLPLHHATSALASTNVWIAEVMNRRVADAARAGTRVTG